MENVWDSQSVLSAMDDLYELVLIRWDQQEEWSPWNCVLLTKEEASAHAKLENVSEVGMSCHATFCQSILCMRFFKENQCQVDEFKPGSGLSVT